MSTQKQGEGVSLQAQKDAITDFASRNDLEIAQWFEEKETAAKRGRPIYTTMLKQLRQHHAEGVIIHKIDRSARNLRDWTDFSELPDIGISVYVATESLDFTSRGGRLTADIQAVIAADYIRNLREECKKGINGRLKQGYYPFKAPLGYLDHGGGKPKTICPKNGPLVKLAFELYASRQYSYNTLLQELAVRGLRNSRGGRLTVNGLSKILTNKFYIGIIYIKTNQRTYKGIHEPLVSLPIWNRVQAIRKTRSGPKVTKHNHLFRGVFSCAQCTGPMVPELQKGHVYYRCKLKTCPTKTVREDFLEGAVRTELALLELSPEASEAAEQAAEGATADIEEQRTSLTLQIKDEERRLDRLQDLLLDNAIDRDSYNLKYEKLRIRLLNLQDSLQKLPDIGSLLAYRTKVAELRKNLVFLYENANRAEKRIIVQNVWPNCFVQGKKPLFKPDFWLKRTGISMPLTYGAHERDTRRTGHGIGDDDMSLIAPLFELLDRYIAHE